MNPRPNPAGRATRERARIRPMYYEGRSLYKDDPKLLETYEGYLKVMEQRMHKHRRMVVVATLIGSDDGKDVIVRALNDVVLLWMDKRRMRLRGFEYIDETEYAQVWEVEFV